MELQGTAYTRLLNVWERRVAFSKNLNFLFFTKIKYNLYVLDRFDVLMSKMIFKKRKNIIGMYFDTKSYLKSTRNHTAKHHTIMLARNFMQSLKKG
jgi:hypothetical protein